MEKAALLPPKDPYGNDTMHADMMIQHAALKEVIEKALQKTLTYITVEKGNYSTKV